VLIEERGRAGHVARNLIRSAELSPSWPVEEVGLELELFDDRVLESRDAVRCSRTS
jgi:hypothetical protein